MVAVESPGARQWVMQRASAVVLAAYALFWMGFFFLGGKVNYVGWKELFAQEWMQGFTFLALVSLAVHAWVGLWTIITDYVGQPFLRGVLEFLVAVVLIGDVIWGSLVLWG